MNMKSLLILGLLVCGQVFAGVDFIYATGENFEIYINPKSHWEADFSLADGYTKSEREFLDPIIKEANLCELQESTYEPCGYTFDDFFWALETLVEHGIKHNKELQNFINQF